MNKKIEPSVFAGASLGIFLILSCVCAPLLLDTFMGWGTEGLRFTIFWVVWAVLGMTCKMEVPNGFNETRKVRLISIQFPFTERVLTI